jgi:trigger factor
MTINASSLQIALEEEERWRRRLTVTVPGSEVEAERSRVAQRLVKRLKLPGFRKGKVPAAVLEKRFGDSLQQETLDRVIGDAYKVALRSEELSPISEGEVQEISYQPETDLTFAIAFDVQPEIDIGRLGGFVVERPSADVPEGQLEQVLDRLREQHGAWKPEESGTPSDGQLVNVEILRLDGDGAEPQSYEFVLGSGDAIPAVEDAIRTLEPGADGEYDVAFPDDFPDESKRGEHEHLRIGLVSRKTRELPELSDEFARSIGEFEGLADLTAKVTADLERESGERAEGAVRARLLDFLVDANPFSVPVSMVDRYIESLLGDTQGADPEKVEEFKVSLQAEAERAVKRILLIERVADTQELRASEEEIDERVEEIAERASAQPAQVYARLQKSGGLEQLEREITEKKVFGFLLEQSEITDAA